RGGAGAVPGWPRFDGVRSRHARVQRRHVTAHAPWGDPEQIRQHPGGDPAIATEQFVQEPILTLPRHRHLLSPSRSAMHLHDVRCKRSWAEDGSSAGEENALVATWESPANNGEEEGGVDEDPGGVRRGRVE